MKQILIKGLALLLACLMLLPVLASCNTDSGEQESNTEAESQTETATDSGGATDTVAVTEITSESATEAATSTGTEAASTEAGTEGNSEATTQETTSLNYIPLEFETKPEIVLAESVSRDYLEPISWRVEGENFTATSIPSTSYKSTATNASEGYVFYSGGYTPKEWGEEGFDITKYTKEFDVVYEITVPASGYYKLTTSAGDRNHYATTNFSVIIDDREPVHCSKGKVVSQVPHIGNSTLGELFELLDVGVFYLKRGEHRITFRMDNTDGYNDMDHKSNPFKRICFMMDYFEFNRVYSDNDAPIVTYAADVSKDENVAILKEAAEMNVFDESYPVHIKYVHFFEDDGRGSYTITDHSGKVIKRKYFEGTKNEIRSIEITIENHPTGYFKLQAGDYVEYYLVLPAFADRTVTDSPFAMDSALTQRVANLDRIASYSAIYRMMGITWVRERMAWGSYQEDYDKTTGVYTYDEEYAGKIKDRLTVIKNTGLNVLLTFSSAAQWAKDLAKAVPGSQVTDGNTLGTYGTQLAAYDALKRVSKTLDGVVDIMELMNEPDHTFRDIAEHYSGWFKAAALGVIDSGSDMAISIAGMCQPTNWKDFFGLTMSSDLMKYSSIYNFHSHKDLPPDTSVPDYGGAVTMKNFPQALSLLGITQPIWISESGMKMPSEIPTDTHLSKQAPYIISSAVQALSYGVDKYFWFLGTRYTEAGGDYGSFSANDRAYPTMAAYAVMTKMLGEGKYIGELHDLPDGVRGYLFNTGERVVAVVWKTTGTKAYTFNAEAPVIVTSMMGEQKFYEPKKDKGTITLNIGVEPVYITYSIPPEEYYAHSYSEPDEIVQPTLGFGDRIVITPEFEGYIFSESEKYNGHQIKDGSVINVRVVNHNEVAVTGKISVEIPGFEITGIDKEVTVQPHSEEFIKLTLSYVGPEIFDDHLTFTGTFWEAGKTEAEGVACSPTSVSVYSTESIVDRRVYFTLSGNLSLGNQLDPKTLKDVLVYIDGFVMDIHSVKVNVNDKELDSTKIKLEEAPGEPAHSVGKSMILTMDLSDLAPGKYMVYIGVISDGGDIQVQGFQVRYDGETVRFTTDW